MVNSGDEIKCLTLTPVLLLYQPCFQDLFGCQLLNITSFTVTTWPDLRPTLAPLQEPCKAPWFSLRWLGWSPVAVPLSHEYSTPGSRPYLFLDRTGFPTPAPLYYIRRLHFLRPFQGWETSSCTMSHICPHALWTSLMQSVCYLHPPLLVSFYTGLPSLWALCLLPIWIIPCPTCIAAWWGQTRLNPKEKIPQMLGNLVVMYKIVKQNFPTVPQSLPHRWRLILPTFMARSP